MLMTAIGLLEIEDIIYIRIYIRNNNISGEKKASRRRIKDLSSPTTIRRKRGKERKGKKVGKANKIYN